LPPRRELLVDGATLEPSGMVRFHPVRDCASNLLTEHPRLASGPFLSLYSERFVIGNDRHSLDGFARIGGSFFNVRNLDSR